MNNIEQAAEDYAREMWGNYYDKIPLTATSETLGEICKKDFIAGYEFAKNQEKLNEKS